MQLLILALPALLAGFVSAQTLSTNTNPLNTGGPTSASVASILSVMASEISTFSTEAGHVSLTSFNPNSVTQSDLGHVTATSSRLSSVATAQSTAGNDHQSALMQSETSTGASATHAASSNGNIVVV
jgi:hypothetical protein